MSFDAHERCVWGTTGAYVLWLCVRLPDKGLHGMHAEDCDALAGRVPAMFNGCVGVKPTVGRLSTQGVVPACASLDCVSVFAQTVADAAAVVRVAQARGCPFHSFLGRKSGAVEIG